MSDKTCPFDCPNKKHISLTEISKTGEVEHYKCCEQCPLIKNESNESKEKVKKIIENMLNDIFKSLIFTPETQTKLVHIERKDKAKCPKCNSSLEDISNTGRIGCAECYVFFKDSLKGLINSCQKSIKHTGKIPKRWQEKNKQKQLGTISISRIERDLSIVNLKLKNSIKDEKYEAASSYKEIIKKLEQLLLDFKNDPSNAGLVDVLLKCEENIL